MSLTTGNKVRGLYLLLFTASSIISFINYHTNAWIIAILCLIGFIAYDVVCYLRDKNPPAKDLAPDLEKLRAEQNKLSEEVTMIKNDHGIAALAASFKRK